MNLEPKIDWGKANFRRIFRPEAPIEPAVDEIVSKIVGKRIYQQDPRLIKLIVKWRKGKPLDSEEPDNFLDDFHKIEEMRKVLNQPI